MTASRVLSAAAALREFDLDQVAAFCDEPHDVIVAVLTEASSCVQRVGEADDRWRVIDQKGLRRRSRALGASEQTSVARPRFRPTDDLAETRLRYAEESLLSWDDQRPYEERRLQLMATTNALQQAAAGMSSTPRVWWKVEIAPGSLVLENLDVDAVTLTRLQVAEAVACLTKQGLYGQDPDPRDIVASARRLQVRARDVDLQLMSGLVGRFVDLVLALAVPTSDWAAPGRLVATTAIHRVRAEVRKSPVTGLDGLIPVVEGIGGDRAPSPGLFEELDVLPAGCRHVVVYTELLELLPRHFEYRASKSRLLGTLTEAVAAPDTADQLRSHASWLEQDLIQCPYGSDNALIGSAVHTLQQIAEYGARDDTSLIGRSDRRCSALLRLAEVTVG